MAFTISFLSIVRPLSSPSSSSSASIAKYFGKFSESYKFCIYFPHILRVRQRSETMFPWLSLIPNVLIVPHIELQILLYSTGVLGSIPRDYSNSISMPKCSPESWRSCSML